MYLGKNSPHQQLGAADQMLQHYTSHINMHTYIMYNILITCHQFFKLAFSSLKISNILEIETETKTSVNKIKPKQFAVKL